MIKKYFLLPILICALASCTDSEKTEQQDNETKTTKDTIIAAKAGINPPISHADVPYMNVKLDAGKGGVFVSKNGSIVTFPENAVLNADGTPAVGEFDITYREFLDPLDIYFAGIPMNYDSAGIGYNFISAGMCELNASQNGNALKVNPSAEPEVQLVSRDSDPAHNLYYYDKKTDQWLNKGKPELSEMKAPVVSDVKQTPMPVKLVKKDETKHRFTVAIDKSEVAMSAFDGYDQMEFQIADEEKNYKPSDAKIHWTGVKVEKSTKYKGKYDVIFTSANITKTYLTDPVFSEADYQKAIKHYEKTLKENKALADKADKYNKEFDQKQAAIIKQNKIVDSINKEIAIQNKEYELYYDSMVKVYDMVKAKNLVTKKYNDSIKEINAELKEAILLEQKKQMEAYEAELAKLKALNKVNIKQDAATLNRGFRFSEFGMWNCDNPYLREENVVTTTINLESYSPAQKFTVIYESLNSVFDNNQGTFKNLQNTNEVLFFVENTTLYYLIVQDDAQQQVDQPMIEMDVSDISFDEIKQKLMGRKDRASF